MNISAVSLITANLIPVAGVLFFKWSIFNIMFVYWLENVVIGFYNILKIALAKKTNPPAFSMNSKSGADVRKYSLILFFILHYGLFTLVHGIFVLVVFGFLPSKLLASAGNDWFYVSWNGLLFAVIMLFVSHGISFKTNYLGAREYERVSPADQFSAPYTRIVIMHLVLICGGFAFLLLPHVKLFGLCLVVLKITLDLLLQGKEHILFSK